MERKQPSQSSSEARISNRAAHAFLLACACASVLLTGSRARADDDGKALAAKSLDEGIALFAKNDHKGALDAFRLAYAKFPSPKILINVAMALEALGRDAEAADAYDRFIVETAQVSDITSERKVAASNALARLTKRVARLVFEVPDTAALAFDGQPIVLRSGRPMYVTPGTHRVSASAPGFITKVVDLELAAGEVRPLAITLEAEPVQVQDEAPPEPDAPANAAPGPAASTPAPSAAVLDLTTRGDSMRAGRKWTWIVAGSAGAFAITASVFGLRARSAYADYEQATDPDRYEDLGGQVRRDAFLANVFFAGSAAALIVAGALFIVEPTSNSRGVQRAAFVPVGTDGWALAARGRF